MLVGGAGDPRELYDMSIRIFLHAGRIKRSHSYESVVAEMEGEA